jgi:6-phosphogluconolactonase
MKARFGYLAFIGPLWAFGCGSSADDGPRDTGSSAGSPATGGRQSSAGSGGASSGVAGTASGSSPGGQSTTPGGSGAMPSGGAGGGTSAGGAAPSSGKAVVYVGGFGEAPLSLYDLDKSTGVLTERPGKVDAGPEPTCLALDASGKHLYVCSEDDGEAGGVTTFDIAADGSLTERNHRSGSDGGFTSLAISPSGKLIAGASYGGGSASLFPINADGSVGAEVDVFDFGGGAQSHGVGWDPTGKFLLVTTKGADAVQQLKAADNGTLLANTPQSVPTAPDSGPRHVAVHPSGKLAFVVTENGSTVIPYQLSAAGTLTAGTVVSSLPAGWDGQNTGAHVELSLDGQLLYASNRGHDSVGVFSVNQDNGALTLLQHAMVNGASPHDFDVDREGKLLITANRRGNSLSVLKIGADGRLSAVGAAVPTREEPTAVLIHDLK